MEELAFSNIWQDNTFNISQIGVEKKTFFFILAKLK